MIAQKLAGYTLSEADILRKAMAKRHEWNVSSKTDLLKEQFLSV